jgi:hypothetical protein
MHACTKPTHPPHCSETFNFLKSSDGEWLFLVVADVGFSRQAAFACLERTAQAWEEGGFQTRARQAAAHTFDRAFKPRIRDYVVRLGGQAASRVMSAHASASLHVHGGELCCKAADRPCARELRSPPACCRLPPATRFSTEPLQCKP